jgi:hypothetical protein
VRQVQGPAPRHPVLPGAGAAELGPGPLETVVELGTDERLLSHHVISSSDHQLFDDSILGL